MGGSRGQQLEEREGLRSLYLVLAKKQTPWAIPAGAGFALITTLASLTTMGRNVKPDRHAGSR